MPHAEPVTTGTGRPRPQWACSCRELARPSRPRDPAIQDRPPSRLTAGLPRLRISLRRCASSYAEGSRVEWEVLLTAEVEAFLDELYESDPVSHQLVNQAILVLERTGPAEGRPLVDNDHRVTDCQHEGTAAAVSRAQRDPDPAGLRPVAFGGPARGRRQVRAMG